jgi:acetylserotonin N-methyltransferase
MRYQLPATEDRPIWDIWLSMHQLPSMAVADELRVFEALKGGAKSSGEVARELGLNPRATGVLLRMLASLGLVRGGENKYALTDASRTYLLAESPYYWGPLLRALGVVPEKHSALIAVLKGAEAVGGAGKGFAGQPGRASEGWAKGGLPPEVAAAVSRVMHCHSLPASVAVAQRGGLEGVKRLLDVGGGSGCFSIAIAQHFPDVRCTVMELATVCDVARGYIAQGGVDKQVDVAAVDMFREAWPTGYDGVFLSNVFHEWNEETNAELARAAFAVLPSGGRIFLHEMLVDEDGGGPLTSASFSMLMLLGTQGRQYALSELAAILQPAGFVDVRAQPTYGYYSVVSGRKP